MTQRTRPEADRRPRSATRGERRSPTFGEGRRAVVLVVSTSARAGLTEDTTGPLLVGWLRERGYRVDGPQVVADGPEVGAALRGHLVDAPVHERPRVLVTTGGTGLAPDDTTPEETRRLLEKEATGIVQALVDHGLAKMPEAAMTRGTAGASGRTFIVNLPGSTGGVKDGITVLDPLLHHIQTQLEDDRDDGVHAPRGDAGDSDAAEPDDAADAAAAAESVGETTEPADAAAAAESAGEATEPAVAPYAFGRVTEEPLDLAAAEARVATPQTGALAVFHGVVRDHDSGRDDVVGLAYTAHPEAQAVLERVLVDVTADHPGVRMSAEHRIGELRVGDDALLVAVASAHRKEAFAACADLVDRVKDRVPIWKRQDYADGAHDWVGVE